MGRRGEEGTMEERRTNVGETAAANVERE